MSFFSRLDIGRFVKEIFGVALISFSAQAFSFDYKYEVVEISSDFNIGFGINDLGMVTGYADNAYLYDGVNVQNLGTLGGFLSSGEDINNNGFVTGYSLTADFDVHAFYYDGTNMNDIGTLYDGGYSFGQGINDAGFVVGYSSNLTEDGDTAFLFDSDTNSIVDIGALISVADDSYAKSINNSGLITGWIQDSVGNDSAYVFDSNDNSVINLGTFFGGGSSIAFDINDSGWVTGYADNSSGINNAFLYDGASLLNLGSLEGGASQAYGLNDLGYVVGESDSSAFLWREGEMLDLNSFIDDSLGINLTYAEDINNLGQILAYDGNSDRSFILNPVSAVPEPSVISMMLGGLSLVGYMVGRRRSESATLDNAQV